MKKIKRIISALLCAVILSAYAFIVPASASSDDINIIMVTSRNKAYVNGEVLNLAEAPVLRNAVIMLPVRVVGEALGASVGYDGETGEISVDGNGHSIRMTNGSDVLTIDGVPTTIDAPVSSVNGTAMVSALVFVESLGSKVFWNNEGIIVIGKTNLNPNNEKTFISETVNNVTGDKYWTYNYETDYVPLAEQQASLVLEPVTQQMVKDAIEETGTIDTHASLFVTEEDIERMKQYLEDGDPVFKKFYDYNIRNANNAVAYALPTYHLDASNLRVEDLHNFAVNSLPSLALAYRLTGEKQYLTRIKDVFAAVATFDDWGAPRHFLDAGVATSYIAIAYDMVYEDMSEKEKTSIEEAIIEKALKPGLEGMNSGEFWTTSQANWNGICHSGLRLGAYVCYRRDPELCSQVIATAMTNEVYYIRAFEPMGQTEEGQSYFDYGLSFTELGFDADNNIMGTDFGYSTTNGLKNAGWFPLRSSGTATSLSIGDADVMEGVAMPRMWLAVHFDDTQLGKIIFEKMESETTFDWRLMKFYTKEFYDRCMNADDAEMQQLDNNIPALDLVSFRSDWTTNGNFISIHAAWNNAAHSQLDAGQVDIQANGVHWVMGSLGKDDYNHPGYFDATKPDYNDAKTEQTVPGRYHMYRLRAEGKTAVVVQADGTPDIRPDQDPMGLPVIEKIVSKPKGGYTIVDLTDCYNRDVQSYKRGIMLSENRQLMTIQDEIVTKSKDSTIWWLMNTPADITIAEDGKSALLTYQSKAMYVQLSSPSNGVFKEIPATYLEGEEFPLSQNKENTTHKLAIELEKTQQATITVDFLPLGIGETEPNMEIPKSRPMKNWSIDNGSLVIKTKPQLTGLTIDGVTPDGFSGENYVYNYLSPMPLDSTEDPVIEATADADITYSKSENVTTITVTDRADPTNYSRYVVTVKKTGAPSSVQPFDIKSATGSDNPEFNHLDEYAIDGSLDPDSRWSAEGEQTLDLDLGSPKTITYLAMAVLNGDTRKQIFDVLTSNDMENWTTVYSGKSGGETSDFEYFKLEESTARYVRILVKGNETGSWNSIVEVQVLGK